MTESFVETLTGGALLLLAVAGLTLVLRRGRSSGGSRRKPTHARAAGPGGDWSGGSSMPGASGARTGPGADSPDSRDGRRSSWAASAEEPDWPYPDHPSWPAGSTGRPLTPDHPSWPAGDVGRPIGYGRPGTAPDAPYDDHPSWPASDPGRPVTSDDYPSGPPAGPGVRWAANTVGPPADGRAGGPQRELSGEPLPPTMHHDQYPRPPAPHVPPARGRHVRVPAGYPGYPGPGVPTEDTPQRWSAQLARNTGPIPQTYYDLDFGDGRLQVVLTETPGADQGWAASPRSTNVLQLTGADTGQHGAVGWQAADPGNADSVRLAQRILADADQQAAKIRGEAAAQAGAIREAAEREAAQIREQTTAETAPIREGAEREAAEIRERAAAEAAATREAAEREVDALRSAFKRMSADLDQMAGYITERLTGPIGHITGTTAPALAASAVPPAPAPARAPSEAPSSHEEAGPVAEAAPGIRVTGRAMPATAPARPGTRAWPARRTERQTRPRQYRIMRVYAGAIATLVVLALGSGAYQLATRGFTFFAFRSAGTGATDNNAIFPGIIPTPKPSPAHHHPTNRAGHHDSRSAHHRRHRPGGTRHHLKAS